MVLSKSLLLGAFACGGCLAIGSDDLQSVCLQSDAAQTQAACRALLHALPDQVFFPDSQNYTAESEAFWDQAAWLQPGCVFQPLSAANLALGVSELVKRNVTFTARSGGHMPVVGHGSLDNGVLVVTTNLLEKTLVRSPNPYGADYIRTGSAFRWEDVYTFLEQYGLATAGGRVSSVGSSLILGGGLSYFSSLHGWAANNVLNYEIVLANGSLVNVNAKSAPDLFWALKGGSSNFGIVTRYDLRVIPIGKVFGGSVTWASNETQRYLDAQTAFILPGGGSYDDNAAIMPNFGYTPLTAQNNSGTVFVYNGSDPDPAALRNLTSIPTTSGAVTVQNFSEVVGSTSGYSPRDRRWSFYNIAVKSAPPTMNLLYRHMREQADTILGGVNASVGAAVQPITVNHLKAAQNAGGDAIALDPSRGPFVIALYYANWFDPTLDPLIKQWELATIAAVKKDTQTRGLYYPWEFLNDSGQAQDPIGTYGYGKSLPRLKAVSKKYDPHGVFQRNVPGFKLGFELHSGC
ncbi:FAD-binding domain-containing protein [Lentithecium fluviatile CBS 122367]|uniref:FAD-binding domain-containing protein n=1 Tax=Lentithecium fluviatile CBS 122367 TaxID=1168545 RepID=A0A6G1IHR2_9PLEO|nr:FAD-binding domain-containing protein [Lentithecium fluviatile CBS 122367]